MIFGYARVSTDDQNLSLQIDALTHYGIDKLFQEKVTGAKKDRPQLEEMINLLREGDSVVIYKLGVPSGKCGFTTLSLFSRRLPQF